MPGIPLLAEEGWPRPKNSPVPKKARTGWSVRRNLQAPTSRRTDHYYGFALSRSRFAPVCGFFGGFATVIDAATSPPLRGGEYPELNFSPIHSHLLSPLQLDNITSRPRLLLLAAGSEPSFWRKPPHPVSQARMRRPSRRALRS